MNRLIFGTAAVVCYVIYFMGLRYVWNRWVPWTGMTDMIALFVMVVVLIPAAAISADRLLKVVRSQDRG